MSIKSLSIRIDESLLARFHKFSDYEGRSANAQILILMREAVEEFEKRGEPEE